MVCGLVQTDSELGIVDANNQTTHSGIFAIRVVVDAIRVEVALSKPIIVIKSGRTQAAAKAAASHTGTLAGSDDVLDAAFRRCGVLRVDSIAELFGMAEVLAKQP